ncbi:MAG: hypothetical protein HGA42_19220 [Nostocales cyanobacterium W4_Combined_metabat2_030]|nr:hypothetical protein [Nostocales cyanobacterium W4_Combined_metabat2_030]
MRPKQVNRLAGLSIRFLINKFKQAFYFGSQQGGCMLHTQMDYLKWNDLIAKHFFKPENAGLPVYLYVSKDLLNDLGRPHGVNWEDFIKAVKKGSLEVEGKGICEKALETFDKWKYGQPDYPPYIAYLALFVLAVASDEDENPQHCYYPRLGELLGEKKATGQYPKFPEMQKLWEDLEVWSSKDKKETLGIFKSRSLGGNRHIGFPISQTLLTDTERKELHNIFPKLQSSYGCKKKFLPLLIKYGKDFLRRRTLRIPYSASLVKHYYYFLFEVISAYKELHKLGYMYASVDDKKLMKKSWFIIQVPSLQLFFIGLVKI